MNIVGRHISISIFLSLVVFIFSMVSFFLSFPIGGFDDLWKKEVMDIPFIIFSSTFSLIVGLIVGLISGLYWKNQLKIIDDALHDIEEGRNIETDQETAHPDLKATLERIRNVQKMMNEQVVLTQRLATEKAEAHENRIQEIISEERNRLARELHDSVSQQLFAASMLMSAITETREEGDDHETKQLKMVESMIHQSQLEMRALLLHLRPVALKGKSIQEGIQELLIELSQKVTINIKWKVEDFPVDRGIEDHLFRILQESVSNTLRHSKAESLEVLLIKRDGFIILRVVDDGVGFDVENAKAGSYGMQNMHERAVEIGGTLKIVSVKNKGTRLEVKVPVVDEGERDD